MVEAVILEDVVAEVMVVIKTARVTDKWELLQRKMVGATGKQVIGPLLRFSWAVGSRDIRCCYHRKSFGL